MEECKTIDSESERSTVFVQKEYKICDVVVGNRICELWSRIEKHADGARNGELDNWWVNIGSKDKPDWVPWLDRHANRISWDIRIKSGNYAKSKWGDTRISKTGIVEMYCNGRKVYAFHFGDIEYGFSKAQMMTTELSEHPFCFWNPEREIGRKIWYKNQPAIIDGLVLEQGCIMIKKDGEGGFDMTNPWDKDSDWPISEWHEKDIIKDDILSKSIWWFRR